MKHSKLLSFSALTGFGIAMAALAMPSFAQPDVPPAPPETPADTSAAGELTVVVVTAQKRASNVQKTPIAMTVLDGMALAQQGKSTLEDALRDVTGLTVQGSNNGATYTIRGIRPSYQTDPAVNVNRDGIFQSNDGVTPGFDIARVEVLKGPQGTLYGRNAVGGVVNIVNTDPKFDTGGYINAGLGNFNSQHLDAALNLKLSDTVASRTAVYFNKHDGYLSNGNDDDNSVGVRQKLRFKPTDALNINLSAEYDHTDAHGGGTVYSPLASHPNGDDYYSSLQQGGVLNDKYAIYGSLDYDFGPALLSLIGSWYKVKLHSDSDLQGQGLQAAQLDGQQTTQEIRLSSPLSSPVTWQVGVYHLHYKQDLNQFATPIASGVRAVTFAAPGVTPSYDEPVTSVDSLAGFGQVTAPISDRFRVTGGLRYTQDKKTQITGTYSEIDRSLLAMTAEQTVDQSAVTGKVGFEYDVTDRSMLYGDISKGFKSGGLNSLGVPAGYETYDPEDLIAYEIGSKNRFLSNRLQLNADLFYYDYTSKQFQAVQPVTGGFPLLVTFNGAAQIYGLEAQLDWQFTDDDKFSGGFGHTHSEITDFNYSGFASRVGEPLENTPVWSGNASYQHVFQIGGDDTLTASAVMHFQSGTDVVTDVVDDDYQKSFEKYDLTLSYFNRSHDFTVTLYGNNITNVTTRSTGYPRPFGITADTLRIDPPATYGISFFKKF